ncbi:retinol dehydrogenase [Dictyobacter alpinus]|uniref:Retinol dehydrogenase n=1 Tax=Dictyobacter alpinus TaxID=2014873 RepID=A0A402BJ90_9CHLR|nr:retinol dehydrogenase [Dictyobacter alpinus]
MTGATSGVGKATALGLAQQGATVVIVARNQAKGEAACQEIRAASGNTSINLLLADLSSQASIQQLATTFLDQYEQLHVFINNAGVFLTKRHLTVDHLEMTFAVNHLAPFLLTQLLLERLKASTPARIVNVCSGAHYTVQMNLQDLQLERGYNVWRAYAQSKLAMLLCSYKLARQLEGSGVTLNCLNPGFVFTNMGMTNVGPRMQTVAKAVLSRLGSSLEKGALTSLYLAMSPEVEQVTGKYYDQLILKQSSKASYDLALQEQVWEASRQMVHAYIR